MSDEPKGPGPDYRPTSKLEQVPAWAIALTEKMNQLTTTTATGFSSIESRLDTVESNLDIQGGSMRELSKRMTRIEDWKDGVDSRLDQGSLRAKTTSEVDLKHESNFGTVFTRLDTQDKKLETLEANQVEAAKERAETAGYVKEVRDSVVGVINNPKVRALAKALWGLAMAYAAAKGLKVLP